MVVVIIVAALRLNARTTVSSANVQKKSVSKELKLTQTSSNIVPDKVTPEQ